MNVMYHDYPICVVPVLEHNNIKNHLISLIEQEHSIKLNVDNVTVSNTDWSIPAETEKPYFKFILPYIVPLVESFFTKIGFVYGDGFKITNSWFQQYLHQDCHRWHTHGSAMWSAIYYIELPSNTETIFQDFKTKLEFKPDVQEGDLIIFSSALPHRSPPNLSNFRKTIISFNIDEYNLK